MQGGKHFRWVVWSVSNKAKKFHNYDIWLVLATQLYKLHIKIIFLASISLFHEHHP
jgi:hypothetical protein